MHASSSPLTVAILAGGFGTRLGPLTRDVPKPMIAIGGRPYLERVIASFANRGLRDIVLLTGYRSDVIEDHFGDGSAFGVRIRYSRETTPLGTGGAIFQARPLLGDRFVLTYGDVLRFFDYDRFVNAHADDPCLAVYPRQQTGNALVEEGRVIRFDKRAPELPFVDAGFSLMPQSVLDLLPPGPGSFEETVFPRLAAERRLSAEIVDLDFFDIGTPEELARTRAALEAVDS